MSQTHTQHHGAHGRSKGVRAVLRRLLGWTLLILGIVLIPLPGPGIVVTALGIAVLGKREPMLRRANVGVKLWLRQLCQSRKPNVKRIGLWLRNQHRQTRHAIHHINDQRAAGHPLPPLFWAAIIVSLLFMFITLGASLHMFRQGGWGIGDGG